MRELLWSNALHPALASSSSPLALGVVLRQGELIDLCLVVRIGKDVFAAGE